MRSYHITNQTTGPVFFDRGVPDVIGYLRLLKRSVPPHMEKAAQVFRHNRRVFIAPPWRQIFRRDRTLALPPMQGATLATRRGFS